jgi:hypothetical protein
MFTEQYVKGISFRLDNALDERGAGKGRHTINGTQEVLQIIWEPGDMTRYTVCAAALPRDPDWGHASVLVAGQLARDSFVFQMSPEGFLSLGYFLEQCGGLSKQNLYTKRKLCQLVAAVLQMDTDANDPTDYSGE